MTRAAPLRIASGPVRVADAAPEHGPILRRRVHPRRWMFAALVATVTAGLLALGWHVLSAGGWSPWEVALFACLAANAPWLGLSAATGLLGLLIRCTASDPASVAVPLPRGALDAPVTLRTVLAVCVREELMDDVLGPLAALLRGLDRTGFGDRFGIAILSDTAAGPTADAEAEAVARFAARIGPDRVLYRRRIANTGFKAGNVMDFLERHADCFDLMLALDADSAMETPAVLRMVRTMQARPDLALLQSTIAGHRADSPFARLMGLGHRPGSLTWAVGQGWWQGDEGPFWGHNALLRIAPFRTHAHLPLLPDGRHILSHDHVEAALLHGAGWGVRVMPDDGGSYERHPPNLPVFLDRDRRWAAGNMQYRHLLRDRSLGALGRFQMLQAILHYALAPLWFAMLPLAALNAAFDAEGTPRGALVLLLLLSFAALHFPRLAGHAVTIGQASPGIRAARLREALAESGFLLLFDPVTAYDKTVTVLAHALGRPRAGWPSMQRSARRVGWGEAAARLWPHTLGGFLILGLLLASGSWFALLLGAPAVAGLVLAVPFSVLTARPDAT
ncbi:glucans biosynthesis glucosyltransferase MdoH [Roseomonas sp. CCTCC AB2023176]|uniref:glucans biosynthesis glucosyltransferase MdoH n=1 Tax=Roseomonas sp. CCTCC AB2023176 TaxID=3342640 RepID=UPI0035DC0DFE